jgi:transposase
MVKNTQVRLLMKLNQKEKLSVSSVKAGMSENTARKYLRSGKLPSQYQIKHTWRTRQNPFTSVFEEVKDLLKTNPGLEAKTIFGYLQNKYPGSFQDGQIRTLQRKIKQWKALEGKGKEVFFEQIHYPGQLSQSDFTYMSGLEITIAGQRFTHLIYHFVLTYSNWETGTICFSESYESLSEGLQNALWELGGVPKKHRTDCLTSAVNKLGNPQEFTDRYLALLRHYGIEGQRTQPRKPNENGDVEQRHYRFKKALDQALLLRCSRDFRNREEYTDFIRELFKQLNSGRQNRLIEELQVLGSLPKNRLEDCQRLSLRVNQGSRIRVAKNTYSVNSRLIDEIVEVRLYAEYLELWYGQRLIEKIPRLKGENKHYIQYRHIIDCLVRKPGAFENYCYKQDLFPTSQFRIAYDELKANKPGTATKEYLDILNFAAKGSESLVNSAIEELIKSNQAISLDSIKSIIKSSLNPQDIKEIHIQQVSLSEYDSLLPLMGGSHA